MTESSAEPHAVAASQFWVKLVKPPPTKYEGLLRLILNIWGVLEAIWPMERDPRYWVVVGQHGSEEGVGVKTAKTRRAAERALVDAQSALNTLSPAAFRERFIEP